MKERPSILVVEDEEDIAELVRYNLSAAEFEPTLCYSSHEALKFLRSQTPEVILLDLMIPGMDGIQLCHTLKQDNKTKSTPIIMLTAKSEESDIIRGLEAGADDYITKPFSPKVLIARVKSVLRRSRRKEPMASDPIEFGTIKIHSGRHEVFVSGKKLDLTKTEFQILRHLVTHPGWVFTRSQIVNAVQGENYAVTDRSVDVQIVGLRRKLGQDGELIETVRGIGYRFKDLP
jgi:two-component system phosphate regulon response regulator PhoB